MKNTVFKSSLFIVLACTFLCIAFASCDNFMNAGSIRREIEESIAYNNAPSCTLIIKAQSEPNQPSIGEFLSDGEKVCKQGYSIDVQFTVNSKYYLYRGMKAVSKTSDSVDRSQYVEFTELSTETEKDNGIYKVRIKLIQCSDDIKIVPVCILQPKPAVQSYTPSNSTEEQYANVPVIINFSLPMDVSIVNKLKLTLYGANVSEYFETPVLSADKKTLTVRPKKDELMTFINTRKVPYDDILVSFEEGITVTTEYGDFPFEYENSSFSVRYIGQQEHKAPDRHDFYITPQSISLANPVVLTNEKFVEGQIDLENADYASTAFIDKVLANTCAGEVYIYGKYLDTETGVRTITVQETFLRDSFGDDMEEVVKTKDFTSQSSGVEFVSEKNGLTSFCIKYQLGYEAFEDEDGYLNDAYLPGGAYSLSVSVADAAENTAQSIDYSVFVVSMEDLPFVPYLTNKVTDYIGKTPQEYRNALKNLRVYYDDNCDDQGHVINNALPTKVFCDVYIPAADITLFCEYKDKTSTLVREQFTLNSTNPLLRYWELPLNVDSVAGLSATIYAYYNGCLFEKYEYIFPALNDLVISYIQEVTAGDRPYDKVGIGFKKSLNYYSFALGLNKETGKIQNIATYGQGSIYFYHDFDWYFVMQCDDLCGEIYDYAQIKADYDNTILPNVQIVSYSIDSSEKEEDGSPIIKITITIAPDSWEIFDEIEIKMEPSGSSGYDSYLTKGEYSFTYENSNLTHTSVNFYPTGMKGFKMTSWDVYSIPEIENAEVLFDYTPPGLVVTRNEDNTYTMVLDDYDGSGCKHGLVTIGQNEYELTQDNNFTWTVPATLLYENTQVQYGVGVVNRTVYIFYESEDNNGNTCKANRYLSFNAEPISPIKDYISHPSSTQLKVSVGEDKSIKYSNYTYKNLKFNIDSFNGSVWEREKTDIGLNERQVDWENNYNKHYEYTVLVNNLPADRFLKVTTGNTVPLYYYLGTNNSGSYDYIMKNGTSKTSVIISSDAPVFIHTMVTSVSYDDCKDWSANTWEFFAAEKGAQVYDFTPVQTEITLANDETMTLTERKQPMVYTIPVGDLLSAQSYCVIAHYANGTYEMSEVMQN